MLLQPGKKVLCQADIIKVLTAIKDINAIPIANKVPKNAGILLQRLTADVFQMLPDQVLRLHFAPFLPRLSSLNNSANMSVTQ